MSRCVHKRGYNMFMPKAFFKAGTELEGIVIIITSKIGAVR